ncbi:MAG: SH3 domain-containing protein, partial [Planctomycetes bacterium]|nr:SH3 domain-containing protein [Planctomycetota bacterium]
DQAALEHWPNAVAPAVTVRNTSLRRLPTHRPVFAGLDEADGFPFDTLQESAAWAAAAVLAVHTTRDGAWTWVRAAHAAGWVPSGDLAVMDEPVSRRWTASALSAVRCDDTPVRAPGGTFLFRAHVGAVLPVAGEGFSAGPLDVLAPVRRPDGRAELVGCRLPAGSAAVLPLPATAGNLAALADPLIGKPYGYGGLYGDRDCSALLRDLFIPLGLLLPRNSADQARFGRAVNLSGLAPQERQRAVLRLARPFWTLIHSPGHIMLYVGPHRGRAAVLHSKWGLPVRRPSGRVGRKIIGRCCITSLRPGIELPDLIRPGGELLETIDCMTLLPPFDRPQDQPT